MPWLHEGAGGGESQDATMEYESLTRASAVTVGSTGARIANGSRHLTFPTATNAANCTVPIKSSGNDEVVGVHFYSCYVGTNGSPTSEIGLLGKYANPTTERYVRIGTDSLIRVYDSGGTQVGHTSKHAISTTGMTHFAICYDYLSPSGASNLNGGTGAANKAYVTVWIDGNVQWDGLIVVAAGTRLLTGDSTMSDMVWGEDLDAAVNRGVDFYMDDHDKDIMFGANSTTAYDSRYLPHVSKRGIIQCVGGAALPPTAVGTHVAWANDYTNLDEYPGDGVAVVSTITNGAKETYTYSASNPTDSADTIHSVQMRIKARETAGAKVAFFSLLRDASANESTVGFSANGTSFVGQMKVFPDSSRPGGGMWVYTDFDLSAGVSNLQFGMQAPAASAGSEVDSMPGPEIVKYRSLMPAGRYFN